MPKAHTAARRADRMTHAFDDAECGRIVEILKAIAHPLRLRVVAVLCERDENVSSLAAELGANQTIVSQQLRILRMSGLVNVDRKGGFAVYSLAEPHLQTLIECMTGCVVEGRSGLRPTRGG